MSFVRMMQVARANGLREKLKKMTRLLEQGKWSALMKSILKNKVMAKFWAKRLVGEWHSSTSVLLLRKFWKLLSTCTETMDKRNEFTPDTNEAEREEHIKRMVALSEGDQNIIGDFSKPYALPLIENPSVVTLKCISTSVMADVVEGQYKTVVDEYIILDCRYKYEYEGGHIKGALNAYSKRRMFELLFNKDRPSTAENKRIIVIFHCEFSKARGPDLCLYLRNYDRKQHHYDYPKLFYPEMYLMEGGYKKFYAEFPHLCQPTGYRSMHAPGFEQEYIKARGEHGEV